MDSRGELRLDPGAIAPREGSAEIELVVTHTDPLITAAVLKRAAGLVKGLNAKVLLVAVHTVPFPAPFESAAASHAYVVGQLIALASESPLPVEPHVVLARDREDGFRYILKPESTVLVGTREHLWRTPEGRLAQALASAGHKVALLHIDR
jgi:hypothetical protein